MRRLTVWLVVLVSVVFGGAAVSVAGAVAPRYRSLPAPASQRGRYDGLSRLACFSVSSCLMVHFARASSDLDRFDGGRAGVLAVPGSRLRIDVEAMSCPTRSFCMAAGSRVVGDGPERREVPAAEVWNGRRWRVLAVPPGPRTRRSIANQQPRDVLDSPLVSVSCATTSACVATGDSTTSGADRDLALSVVRRWDGSSWRADRPAVTDGIGDVSCGSARLCMTGEPNPERFDGRRWTRVALPHIRGAGRQYLLTVRCMSAVRCIGVGSAGVRVQFKGRPFATRTALVGDYRNGRWTTQRLPLAPHMKGRYSPGASGLTDVSCAPESPDTCTAVGATGPPGGWLTGPGDLVARLQSGEWSQSRLPFHSDEIVCPGRSLCLSPADHGLELLRFGPPGQRR